MRKSYTQQMRLDSVPIEKVTFNLDCRDRIVPILRALQFLYSNGSQVAEVLKLIAKDVSGDSRTDIGRRGMDYWHICVLAAVRLGCNFTYDQMQDMAENHRLLRAIMGLGDCDETAFKWRTIRNNICLLKPRTLESINRMIVDQGHMLEPLAIEKVRVDSFVMETCIHYPTESSLLLDGLRKILQLGAELALEHGVCGWRQQRHLLKRIKKLHCQIHRISTKKGPHYHNRMKPIYRELIEKAVLVTQRARHLCEAICQPQPTSKDLFGPNTLQAFIVRTERVADTARRRVLEGETVPNEDKLLSIFEPHTQLYKRGKAGQPIQFGRQVLIYEDAAGFIVRGALMNRQEGDKDVAVRETAILQQDFRNQVRRLSLDRGFHSPENQIELSKLVGQVCLPKPGAKQSVAQLHDADEEFLAARQSHPGIESAIGALQRGNALKRCRDHSELGFDRYLQLAILGRNLQTLGRLLIAKENGEAAAGKSHRQVAA